MQLPEIIFEDSSFVAVLKPAGMIVNNADTTQAVVTLQDWIKENLKSKILNPKSETKTVLVGEYDIAEEFRLRGGIVHRLDKETSGILLIAKTVESFGALKSQFQNRSVHKAYRALAHGQVEPKEGMIDAPVGRLPWNRMRFGVFSGGRSAQTGYTVESSYQGKGEILTLLELKPITGRTHQIRVHLKHIGHPLVADPLYAGRKTNRADRRWCPRLFLHAAKITFAHPTTQEELTLEAPLPQDLAGALASLSKL